MSLSKSDILFIMTGIDTMHSYDPVAILRVIYELIMGTKGGAIATTTNPALAIHAQLSSIFAFTPYELINFFARFAVFSFFFSIVMLIVVILYAKKVFDMKKKIMAKVIIADNTVKANVKGEEKENPKWNLVQEHINSMDPNKWKLAILEADIILADLLEGLGLPGDNIGDKLKAVDKSDFRTIEEAWEGHKIRNAIAHQGSDFLLNDREAKRVIGLYERVFQEFEII